MVEYDISVVKRAVKTGREMLTVSHSQQHRNNQTICIKIEIFYNLDYLIQPGYVQPRLSESHLLRV